MWVLDSPGGYSGQTRFLGRPWAKVPVGPRIGVLRVCGRALLPGIGTKHRCVTDG